MPFAQLNHLNPIRILLNLNLTLPRAKPQLLHAEEDINVKVCAPVIRNININIMNIKKSLRIQI